MKTESLLLLDYRKKENQKMIQKALKRMKPFQKYSVEEDVTLEDVEKLVWILCRKYDVCIQYINMVQLEHNDDFFTASVTRSSDHEWLGSVHGCCLYDLFAKIAIKLYTHIKKGDVERVNNEG